MTLHEHRPAFNPPPPRGMQTVGMLLFLAALFMLFASAMFAYIIIRVHGPDLVGPRKIHLPQLLWVSTAMILAVSVCFHGAIKSVRRERQSALRRWLVLTILCAAAFIAIQTPALLEILRAHYHYMNDVRAYIGQHQAKPGSPDDPSLKELHGLVLLYGLVFIFICLHALHVFGGLIAMVVVTRHGFKGDYDHEHHYGLTSAAMYWHFLDAIWLAMFAIFWLLG